MTARGGAEGPLIIRFLPLRIRSSWQRRKSQIRTVPSSEQVANLLSVGEKLKIKKRGGVTNLSASNQSQIRLINNVTQRNIQEPLRSEVTIFNQFIISFTLHEPSRGAAPQLENHS